MYNYIKAEFYRMFHKRSFLIFAVLVAAGAILFPVLIKILTFIDLPHADMGTTLQQSMQFVMFLPYFALVVSYFFISERSAHTLKNSVAMGITREKIYFSKFILICLTSLALYVSFLILLVLSTAAIFGISAPALEAFAVRAALVSIFLIALSGFAAALGMVNPKAFVTVILYVCIFSILYTVLLNLGQRYEFFRRLLELFSFNRQTLELYSLDAVITSDLISRIMYNFLLYFVATGAGGFFLFRRQEIK